MPLLLVLVASLLVSATSDWISDAKAALDQGNLGRAETALAQALQKDPDNPDALHLSGILRMRQSRFPDAEAAFVKAVRADPARADFYASLGRFYRSQGRLADAAESLNRGLARFKGEPRLLYESALVDADRGDFPAALGKLRSVPTEGAPGEYWETLGRVQASAGNFQDAENAYLQVLKLRPGSIATLRVLSGLALKRADTQRGWDYMAEARRQAPHSPQVLSEFVQVSLANNLIAEAVTAARILHLMEPDSPDYVFLLARGLASRGDLSQAKRFLEQYLRERPEDPNGHLLMGLVLYQNGEFSGAQVEVEEALRGSPDLLEAEYYRGMIAYSLADDERATHVLEGVVARDPSHGRAWLALGKLSIRGKRYAEAVERLGKAGRFLTGDSDVHFQLSRVYQQLGQNEKARAEVLEYRRLKEEEEQRKIAAESYPFSLRGEKPDE